VLLIARGGFIQNLGALAKKYKEDMFPLMAEDNAGDLRNRTTSLKPIVPFPSA